MLVQITFDIGRCVLTLRALFPLDWQRGKTWSAEIAIPYVKRSTTEEDMVVMAWKGLEADDIMRGDPSCCEVVCKL